MASLFTKIIQGEIPGRFVWRDERCVAFLTIQPIRPGHTLVVPRREVEHWIDVEPELAGHLFTVSQSLGRAIQQGFGCRKVGLTILGLEVAHVHLHLMQLDEPKDLDFARQRTNVPPAELDAAAATIRKALHDLGLDQRAQSIS
jgi:histidine triad (HIT) family protein